MTESLTHRVATIVAFAAFVLLAGSVVAINLNTDAVAADQTSFQLGGE